MPNNEGEYRLEILTDKINKLSPSQSECCIYRVHNQLREVNEMAYEPALVSIGPYHRGKERLRMMEKYKLRFLRDVIHRNHTTLEKYFSEMKSLEEEARKYYAEPVGLDSDEFTEMLLLDSCFVVEVLLDFIRESQEDDSIKNIDWMIKGLQRDLMLFENQLPFFVILKMLDMSDPPDMLDLIVDIPNCHHLFICLALVFFSHLIGGDGTHIAAFVADPQVEGPQSPDVLISILQKVLEESAPVLVTARMEAEERRNNIRLREEQDAAYRAALEADQARERQKKEEEERLEREAAEAERKRKEEEEALERAAREAAEKEAAVAKLREEKAQSLGAEPEKGPDVTQVLVRFPNGERKDRRFHSSTTVKSLYDYVDSLGCLEMDSYSLVSNFPRTVYGSDKLLLSLKEAGLHPQASLFVEINS